MRIWLIALAGLVAACGQPSQPTDTQAEIETPIRIVEEEAVLDENIEKTMGSMNPLENDLRDLEIGIRLKDEFVLTEKGAEFVLKATMSNGDVPIDEVLKLERVSDIESALLAAEARDGFYMATFHLRDEDKRRVQAAQTILGELKKTSDGNNDLTFNAIAYTCVAEGVEPSDVYSLTIYARSHPGVEFIPLGSEIEIARSEMPGVAELWDSCTA